MYKILNYEIDKKYWKKILIKNNIHNILYFPEYIMLWELNGDGIAKSFFYKSDYGIVLYPFLVRKINDLKFFQKTKITEIFYDIASPYGYGGPLVKPYNKSDKNLLLEGFIKEFSLFCKKNNIVSEFIRFHPLIENHTNFINRLEIEKMNSVIYVDLSVTEEELWGNYKRNNRKNIKKALRNDIEIVVDEKYEFFDEFLEIYYETMKKNNAKEYYFFPKSFFEFIRISLNKNSVLFISKKNKKIISVELALYDKDIIYSFLGGTLSEYFPLRPNNLLRHKLILWAKEKNIKYYLIGGGYHPGDGIFNYKHSFSKNGIKDFFVGRKIHNIEKYKILEEEFKKHLLNIYPSIDLKQIKYFPIYRYVL
ncbi:GNAT family N-acetyltransferase [Candidatus Atribacteria bacterium HGW-Atribacteria-1]|nr:MAG: GNAT family N-acetyltransferase [Candidatus Atribacteria bacterium HGW-Atribacteria-1]